MRHITVGVFLQYSYCMCWAAFLPAYLAFQATYTCRVPCGPSITTWRFAPNNNEPQQSSLTSPHADMTARDTCMDALLQNENPRKNAGLEVCFDFSSDRCRAALGGNIENFILYASNPTFGSMMNANEYIVLSVGPIILATMTRGAMQTVLVKVTPSKGDHRTLLWYVCRAAWSTCTINAMPCFLLNRSPQRIFETSPMQHRRTMQQERRPPRQGLWLVHECIFVENAFALTF